VPTNKRMRDVRTTFREAAPPAVVVQEVPANPFARGAGPDFQPTNPSLTMTATVGELGPNPVRHLARSGTAMLAARLNAREATNQGGQMRVLLACAIIITTAVALAGCFHHQQATYAEPIARPPLK
jgi:hypothetical protein